MIHVAGPCPMWNILQDPTCDLDGEIAWEGERRTKRRQLFTRVLYACITKNPPRFKRLFLPSFPSFQRSHDSLISCTCFGGKGNRVYLRFFSFFRLFYLIPFPPSSSSIPSRMGALRLFFSIKRQGTVSDRHADRERSGRDVGCEQPRVQLPGKGFQG